VAGRGIAAAVATGAVPATAARNEEDDDQREEGDDNDRGRLYPAWRAGAVSVVLGALRHLSCDVTFSRQYVYLRSYMYRTYTGAMPKLWHRTIEAHRREVRDAVLDTTAALVEEHGLRSVTMSQIAGETGIARATLYRYFADVEAILLAWHERQIAGHLEHLAALRDGAGSAGERLEAVLEAYALISHETQGHHDSALAALLHGGEQVARAQRQLRGIIRDLLVEGAVSGALRDDVAPDELAAYCLHALGAAKDLPSKAAVRRLVTVTLDALRQRADATAGAESSA
jgi:AcrR family transcriptional regulator